MNQLTRIISMLLVLVIIVGFLPAVPIHAFAAETGSAADPAQAGEAAVSRASWIQELVAAFGMAVEEDNYPDNYYSDITAEDPYYKDILIALEFGIIELEAGLPFRPNDPATREFAAQTLNYALGFQYDETVTYTFAEAASVTYPNDIQIAINRGWFQLVGGAFLPENPITTAEVGTMMTDVKAILAGDYIDNSYESSATVSSGVIVVPTGTKVSIPSENVVEITNCPVQIQANDLFVVYYGDLPLAYKALEVTARGMVTRITCTTEGTDNVLTNLDYEGSIEADLENFEGTGSTTFSIGKQTVHMGATTFGIDYDQGKKVLTATKTASLGDGISATISAKISNMKFELVAKNLAGQYRCVMSGDATLSTNVSVDLLEALGQAKTIELGRIYIGGVGYVKLSVEFSLSGEMSLVWTGDIKAGFSYNRGEGFRVIRSFKKKSFTFMAEVTLRSGLRLDAGVDVLVFDANIWAKIGAQMDVKATTYDSGSTRKCLDMEGFMYASIGVDGSIIKIIEFGESYDVYTRSNSPIRAHYHYDDGKLVMACLRGKVSEGNSGTSSDYYTDPESDNFTPGTSNGSSSYTGSGGQTVVVYTYTLDKDNNATITGYSGSASALYIPSTIDGYTVTVIGDSAFKNRASLYSVKIPNTVKEIAPAAFANCVNLTTVTLSKNLTRMGAHAFYNCDSLSAIEIPKSLEETYDAYIYDYHYGYTYGPFYGCDNLWDITFEEGTTVVATGLFANCPGLKNIVIPDTVTLVGPSAFENCKNLSSVKLPAALTMIDDWAFEECTSLTEIVIPDSCKVIDVAAFGNCTALSSVILPKGLTTMAAHAFYNCDALTAIEIPKSLEETYDAYVYDYHYGYTYGPFYGCDNLKDVTFEEGTTVIVNGLFAYCSGLESIVIPKTITAIESRAFYHSGITEITIPNNITSVGDHFLSDCLNLKTVTWSGLVSAVPEYAFAGSAALEAVELPDSITTFYKGVFRDCDSFVSIDLPQSLASLGDESFYDCNSLASIAIPENVVYIGNNAFYNCDKLTSVTIPENVTSLGSKVFYDCDLLETVTMGNSVTGMGNSIFEHCDVLKNVTLSRNLSAIPASAFKQCSLLEEIRIPYYVTSIGNYAFDASPKLVKVTMPRGLTSISSSAFSYPKTTVIYGVPGTYAETWASNNGFLFVPHEVNATSISINKNELTLYKGDSETLVLSINPDSFTDQITWKSSDTSVVTVSDTGIVKAVGVGTATIKVTVGGKSASCKVTVNQPVTYLYLNSTRLTLDALATYQLVATVSPDNAFDSTVTWSTSDPSVATVDENGLVTALKKGTATITVTANDGCGAQKTCTVTVTNTCYIITDPDSFESTHPYTDSCKDVWAYTVENADMLDVTFDSRTAIEDGFDYLYIYDGAGQQIGVYTGQELAGKTVRVSGNTVRIQIISDGSGNDWGFKVTDVTAHTGKKDGWLKENGQWVYYKDGVKVKNAWAKDGTKWCYLGSDGYIVTNKWVKDGDQWCYVDKYGYMVVSGWAKDAVGWCYMNKYGYITYDKWVNDGKGWSYVNKSGYMVTNKWVKDGSQWCYVDKYGYMLTNGWAKDGNKWCYVDKYGYMVTDKWVKDGSKWCYIDKYGYMLTNGWAKDGSKWCYLGADGYQVFNKWAKDGSKWCYIGADGYQVFNTWAKDAGKWCYIGSDGYQVFNAWAKDGSKWCYIGADGYQVFNKWVKDGKYWAYIGSDGYMATNKWIDNGSSWSYVDANGHALTGTHTIDGKKYTFDADGEMPK